MPQNQHELPVAIVGAGFSGTLLAINLLRQGARVVLVERERHARVWWDVHRHRLAPPVAEKIAAMQAEGRLRFVAGRVMAAQEEDGAALVSWRRRGREALETLRAGRIITCTGPEGDLGRCAHPFLRSLLAEGRVRGDVHGLGLDADQTCRLVDAKGQHQHRLFAIGPLTKGDAWEIIAVPDIRRQVWDLARYLANAHWVGGEGL